MHLIVDGTGNHDATGRGKFLQPESGRALLDSIKDLTSPVGEFVRDRCTVAPGVSVKVDDLYQAWLAWLKDTTSELPLRIAAARMARVGTGLVDAEVTLAPAGQR